MPRRSTGGSPWDRLASCRSATGRCSSAATASTTRSARSPRRWPTATTRRGGPTTVAVGDRTVLVLEWKSVDDSRGPRPSGSARSSRDRPGSAPRSRAMTARSDLFRTTRTLAMIGAALALVAGCSGADTSPGVLAAATPQPTANATQAPTPTPAVTPTAAPATKPAASPAPQLTTLAEAADHYVTCPDRSPESPRLAPARTGSASTCSQQPSAPSSSPRAGSSGTWAPEPRACWSSGPTSAGDGSGWARSSARSASFPGTPATRRREPFRPTPRTRSTG